MEKELKKTYKCKKLMDGVYGSPHLAQHTELDGYFGSLQGQTNPGNGQCSKRTGYRYEAAAQYVGLSGLAKQRSCHGERLTGRIFRKWRCLLPDQLLGHHGGSSAWKRRYRLEILQPADPGYSDPEFGRTCVSQVTGTAAWMDMVSTQYILGIRSTQRGMLIDPSIPPKWDS